METLLQTSSRNKTASHPWFERGAISLMELSTTPWMMIEKPQNGGFRKASNSISTTDTV